MRKFIDILTENPASSKDNLLLMLEGRTPDYRLMFDGLVGILNHLAEIGTQEGDFHRLLRSRLTQAFTVIKGLGRRDRMIWAARIIRLELVHDALTMANPRSLRVSPEIIGRVHEQLTAMQKRYTADYRAATGHDFQSTGNNPADIINRQWNRHFAGINYAPIQNYLFGNKTVEATFTDLDGLEDEYKANAEESLVKLQPGDEIILPVGAYCWVMLNRGYCRDEADAMGHCGNAGARSGDRILSLRKFAQKIDGVDYYSVYLTFILGHDGYLGEMKGRANEKPAVRYHAAIMELLKLPMIKGVRGGGYAPENNFSMKDLSDAQREALLDSHPHLGGWEHRLKKQGDTPEFREQLLKYVTDTFGWARDAVIEEDRVILHKWDSGMDALILTLCNDDDDALAVKIATNGLDFENYEEASDDSVESFFDDLPIVTQIELSAIAKKYLEDGGDEDELEDFDEGRTSEIVKVLSEHEDPHYEALQRAVQDGRRYGAEGEAHKALIDEIKDLSAKVGTLDIPTYKKENGETGFIWDDSITLSASLEEAAKIADSMETKGDENEYDEDDSINAVVFGVEDGEPVIDVEEPTYGWDGFDELMAIEQFFQGEVELSRPKAPEMDLDTLPIAEIKAWMAETYEKIPHGMTYKGDYEKEDEANLRRLAKNLFHKFYKGYKPR